MPFPLALVLDFFALALPFPLATSGLVVTEAVRDAKSNLYDAKMAKLHEIDVTSEEVTTQRAQSMLNTATNSIQFEGVSVPWRQMYPEPTDFLLFFS